MGLMAFWLLMMAGYALILSFIVKSKDHYDRMNHLFRNRMRARKKYDDDLDAYIAALSRRMRLLSRLLAIFALALYISHVIFSLKG